MFFWFLVLDLANQHILDYKTLAKMSNLSAADREIVQRQLIQLPPRTKAAQEKEMGEMMGKLKEVSIHHSCFGQSPNYSSLVMVF